jgi:tagaturonate epimerase
MMIKLAKYSFGVGDRFSHQAEAQLAAVMKMVDQGIEVVPVWNKSHREHTTIGSQPADTRQAADTAVRALEWNRPYHVDADHINLDTVDHYLESSDFYTIDVADSIGISASDQEVSAFVDRHPELIGQIEIPSLPQPLTMTGDALETIVRTYLQAVLDASAVYRHIEAAKGEGTFITEISLDETDQPQQPPEMLVILAAIADQGIPTQTIAPKFSGRFNKGVDYVKNEVQFAQEFDQDLAVVAHAIDRYGLPDNLKLSVHSGSDKFSIYHPIRQALHKHDAGVHVKTAGTTWLEELIGLAEANSEGLALAQEIYIKALAAADQLCAPYAAVIDIDHSKLPTPEQVAAWTSEQYIGALRHDPTCPEFNPSFRQLLHVGYKIAAQMGDRYTTMLVTCQDTIAKNVTENLLNRHLIPLFEN